MPKSFLPVLCALVLFASCKTAVPNSSLEETDDTSYLQSLLDSPSGLVVIPARDEPWISGPLFLTASNKRIVLEEGCTISAKRGLFLETGDCLLTIRGAANVSISGYGAVLEMRKADYAKKPYAKGEWRHGISILESRGITVEGLAVRNAGGDGIYVGQPKDGSVCENTVLKDLELSGNYRQGVSVISARNFLMEGCVVTGTKGTPPMAGIDFEPNSGLYGFTGCVVRNCVFERNSGPGILMYLTKMTPAQPPVDVLVENTVSRKNLSAIAIYGIPRGVRGSVAFTGCALSGLRWVRTPEGFTVTGARR